MKRIVLLLVILLLFFGFSISCKKDNNTLSIKNEPTEFRIRNYNFTTYKYDKLFVNKLQNFSKKQFKGIFIGNNVDYQNGKIISKINKRLFILILDSNDNVLNIYPSYSPVFHCDCIDDNNPFNYCEDFVDDQGRLRCRGSSCCEGYLTDDGGGSDAQKIIENDGSDTLRIIENGIVVTCDELIYNNQTYK